MFWLEMVVEAKRAVLLVGDVYDEGDDADDGDNDDNETNYVELRGRDGMEMDLRTTHNSINTTTRIIKKQQKRK